MIVSEDGQDLILSKRTSFLRWSFFLLFFVLLQIFIFSSLIEYPTIVSAPFKLTTLNPPVPVYAKRSGRIDKWYVTDGRRVAAGDVLAVLDNAERFDKIRMLECYLEQLSDNLQCEDLDLVRNSPEHLQELKFMAMDQAYAGLKLAATNLKRFLDDQTFQRRTEILKERMANEKLRIHFTRKQWELKQEEFKLGEDIYRQDSIAYFSGGYGVIKTDYERSLQIFIALKSSLLSMEASVIDADQGYIDLREALLQSRLKRDEELMRLRLEFGESLMSVRREIASWYDEHVFRAPIDGSVTLTKFWARNQRILSGERLATITPSSEAVVIARSFIPAANLVHVKQGQSVKIKLSGFPPARYGVLEGRVKSVSAIPEEEGYLVEIDLASGMTSTHKENLRFIQEMDGVAEIVIEERKFINRFQDYFRAYLQFE